MADDYRSLPESPRWLLVNGKEKEAVSVLTTIARSNGVSPLPEFTLKGGTVSKGSSHGIVDLFRGPVIRHRTLVLICAW